MGTLGFLLLCVVLAPVLALSWLLMPPKAFGLALFALVMAMNIAIIANTVAPSLFGAP